MLQADVVVRCIIVRLNRHAPCHPEEVPSEPRRLLDHFGDILLPGELGMLAETLHDGVAQASVLIDGGLVNFVERLSKLGGLPMVP